MDDINAEDFQWGDGIGRPIIRGDGFKASITVILITAI